MRQVPRPVAMEAPLQPPSRQGPAGAIVDVRAEPETPKAPTAAAVPMPSKAAEPEAPKAPARPRATAPPRSAASNPEPPAVPAPAPAPAKPAAAPAREPIAAPASPAAPTESAQPPVPSIFNTRQETKPRWPKVLIAVGLAAAGGLALYGLRGVWYPAAAAPPQRTYTEVSPPAIGLNTVDSAGQLQIRWDPNAAAVRSASSAWFEIGDGDSPRSLVPLDLRQLASGVFTYQRRDERVDVTMELDQPGGTKVRQSTGFLGPKPPAPVPVPAPAPAAAPAHIVADSSIQANRERDEALKTAASLRAQLAAERERSRNMEKELDAARAQLRQQQLRRLSRQALPPGQ